MKVIAFYLPQFHTIPENDEWWGKGFTEWKNVRNAVPLFEGHQQPRVPLNSNYYNLLDIKTMRWQVDLAKEYGIYGFCMYHYWFGGHKLLEKPVELFQQNRSLDTHFCICWANENWTKTWAAEKNSILISQKYGNRSEWKEHFDYLLPFFKDERYIKEDNKPLFVIYKPEIIPCLHEMLVYWNELAMKHGFSGLLFASQYPLAEKKKVEKHISYIIEYQPISAFIWTNKLYYKFFRSIKNIVTKAFGKIFQTSFFTTLKLEFKLDIKDYDKIWKAILTHNPTNEKSIPGAFVDWDNTPRRHNRGSICLGASPAKFKKYFLELIKKAKIEYTTDYLFVFAWNEWAEGGYLEPDEKNQYQYLQAIKECLEKTGESIN